MAAASPDASLVFIELGAVILGLALVARLSARFGLSAIPLYLVAGLFLGEGGVASLDLTEDFIELTAEIGVILLLLTLGLEYSASDLVHGLRTGLGAGVLDLVANATPGLVAGLAMGWDLRAAILLAGITYISSSGVVAKLLNDLGRLGNRETPAVLSLLVIEDLAMALYLPSVAVLLAGRGLTAGVASVTVAVGAVGLILLVALRYGRVVSRALSSRSDEVLLLSVLGLTLLVAGLAERLLVSSAVGAFLVGIAVSGPLQARASTLVGPLRDLFAATFFLFFSLQVDPADLAPAVVPAVALAVVTALTKVLTGWQAAAHAGVGRAGRLRAGTVLIARGEFSIVIAGLGVAAGVEADLAATAAAYVLILAIVGPFVTRYANGLGGARPQTRVTTSPPRPKASPDSMTSAGSEAGEHDSPESSPFSRILEGEPGTLLP